MTMKPLTKQVPVLFRHIRTEIVMLCWLPCVVGLWTPYWKNTTRKNTVTPQKNAVPNAVHPPSGTIPTMNAIIVMNAVTSGAINNSPR